MAKKQSKFHSLLYGMMPYIIDLIWVIGFIAIVSSSLVLTDFIKDFLLGFDLINRFIVYGISAFAFINLYIIICGLLFRIFVPKMKAGRAKVGISKEFFIWRLNWHFYSYVFLFIKKYVFYNRTMRYIFLRLFRVNVRYSTYFAETVDLQDANNLLTIGEISGLGSEVIISTHLALSPRVIVFKEVTIGDNSHIQSRVSIAPGVSVGNNSIVGFDTGLSLNVSIGDNTRIGPKCSIHSSVKIGDNCKIGASVYIGERVVIPDGAVVPDGSQLLTMEDFERLAV